MRLLNLKGSRPVAVLSALISLLAQNGKELWPRSATPSTNAQDPLLLYAYFRPTFPLSFFFRGSPSHPSSTSIDSGCLTADACLTHCNDEQQDGDTLGFKGKYLDMADVIAGTYCPSIRDRV